MLSFFCSFLYLIQFTVYTSNYIQFQLKTTGRGKPFVKQMFTMAGVCQGAVTCWECAKTGLQLGLDAEGAYKLTHGGMNEMTPWR